MTMSRREFEALAEAGARKRKTAKTIRAVFWGALILLVAWYVWWAYHNPPPFIGFAEVAWSHATIAAEIVLGLLLMPYVWKMLLLIGFIYAVRIFLRELAERGRRLMREFAGMIADEISKRR
jgi:hypothetical protein